MTKLTTNKGVTRLNTDNGVIVSLVAPFDPELAHLTALSVTDGGPQAALVHLTLDELRELQAAINAHVDAVTNLMRGDVQAPKFDLDTSEGRMAYLRATYITEEDACRSESGRIYLIVGRVSDDRALTPPQEVGFVQQSREVLLTKGYEAALRFIADAIPNLPLNRA